MPRDHYFRNLFRMREPGKCVVCREDLTGRKRSYCSEDCMKEAYQLLWKNIVRLYLKTVKYKCERCRGMAQTVHHVIPVMYRGISHWTNLMALCFRCHTEIHVEIGTYKVLAENRRKFLEEKRLAEELAEVRSHYHPLEYYFGVTNDGDIREED